MNTRPLLASIAASLWLMSACAGPSAHPDACTQELTSEVANACVVSNGVLWRGGKPDSQGALALMNKGVGTVVNLEMLHSDKDAFRQAKGAPTRSVDYFEVPEWEPNVVIAPGRVDDSVAEFIAIVRTQPRPVYVHCRSGQNRTGVMVAAQPMTISQSSAGRENVPTAACNGSKYTTSRRSTASHRMARFSQRLASGRCSALRVSERKL